MERLERNVMCAIQKDRPHLITPDMARLLADFDCCNNLHVLLAHTSLWRHFQTTDQGLNRWRYDDIYSEIRDTISPHTLFGPVELNIFTLNMESTTEKNPNSPLQE
jgi:hypothetical protein